VLRDVPVASPGVGQPVTIIVPGSFEWRPVALNFAFACSATVAQRGVFLRLMRGVAELVRVPIAHRQAPSSSCTYTYSPDVGEVVGGTPDGQLLVPLPAFPLVAGYTLEIRADNIQAGDLFAAITLTVRERFSGSEESRSERRPRLVEPLALDATMVK
jgi:hypothetical protein